MPASITVINKPLEFRGRKDRRDHSTVSHNAVAARSTPIAKLKVRIREPTLSQCRRAEPTHVQVIRLPIAAVENTMTIIAILTNVGWFVMNDPAVAAASIHAFGLAYWKAADCQNESGFMVLASDSLPVTFGPASCRQ